MIHIGWLVVMVIAIRLLDRYHTKRYDKIDKIVQHQHVTLCEARKTMVEMKKRLDHCNRHHF